MRTGFNAIEIFQLAEQIERNGAKFYRRAAEGFEDPARLWKVHHYNSHPRHDTLTLHSGQAAQWLYLDFRKPLQWVALGLAPANPDTELPVLVSPAFLDAANVAVGDTASVWLHSAYIPLRVVGLAHYFPTMYEDPAS